MNIPDLMKHHASSVRSLLIGSLFVVTTMVALSQQRYDIRIPLDGHIREVIVQIPSGGPPAGGYAVVFMNHGSSGDGSKFYAASGWKELGEQEKFVTCFPSSLEWCVTKDEVSTGNQNPHQTTKWVNGDLVSIACPGQEFISDVAFFRAMVDSLKAKLPVDPRRIYCSGFSNGALMVSKLSVEASDIFAAFAGTGGSLHAMDSAVVSVPRPYWFGFGTHDDRFYEAAGRDSLPFNDTTAYIFRGLVNRFLGCYQLTTDSTLDTSDIVRTYTYQTPRPGTPGTVFKFSIFNGLTHQFPNGRNTDFDGPRNFWEFFRSFTLPTSVEEEAAEPAAIYPNPASATVTVSSDIPPAPFEQIRIHDAVGRVVQTAPRVSTSTTVDVSTLPAGVYLLRIQARSIPLIINR